MTYQVSPTKRTNVNDWMKWHVDEFDTATELAEASANAFGLHGIDCRIPEWVFELAADVQPIEG